MNICIFGMGYVGTAAALFLSIKHKVKIIEIDELKIKNFNNGILPINEIEADDLFKQYRDNLSISNNLEASLIGAEIAIISLPTNFDESTLSFDTDILDETIERIIKNSSDVIIIIKSTVNVGYTSSLQAKYPKTKIFFSPEFLREGNSIFDSMNPSRIIVGGHEGTKEALQVSKIFSESAKINTNNILFMGSTEAESVKLFSNTFLAARVAFFNELDSFCLENNLSSHSIINGVCKDPRIMDLYNNPSFGFGGYCLPKDSKQLESRFNSNIPNQLVSSINQSNDSRKVFLARKILTISKGVIGIYKLSMKHGSDNYRESSIIDIIRILASQCKQVCIYDENISASPLEEAKLVKSFKEFCELSDLIVTNRLDERIESQGKPIFTRDIFTTDA